jgi:hypothetical protein
VAGWGAALLAACCFTLPVAGTSLALMDAYVRARSFSTPFTLFALAAILKEQWLRAAAWITLAALVHPLMAAYALVGLVTVALARRKMWRSLAALIAVGWIGCALIFFATLRQPSPAALSRSYFFLSSWRWFEYFGLIMPLLLLGITGVRHPRGFAVDPQLAKNERDAPDFLQAATSVAIAATICGAFALLVSLCFVHRSGSLIIARVQPLRAFHFVYLAGVLLTGSWLSRQRKEALAGLVVVLLAIVLWAQRVTYPSSDHVEWPWLAPRNPWQQAFLWIREHTPQNAIFALDNDYIQGKSEDAQGFRATAERSTVADYFKDGGIASNFPQAASLWQQGSQATARLNQATDAERRERLAPLGVTWMVLPAASTTGFPCPYINPGVRVCRLGPF